MSISRTMRSADDPQPGRTAAASTTTASLAAHIIWLRSVSRDRLFIESGAALPKIQASLASQPASLVPDGARSSRTPGPCPWCPWSLRATEKELESWVRSGIGAWCEGVTGYKAESFRPDRRFEDSHQAATPTNCNMESDDDDDDAVAVETVPLIRSNPKFVQGRIVLNEEDE